MNEWIKKSNKMIRMWSMNKWMNEWMNEWLYEYMNGWKNE